MDALVSFFTQNYLSLIVGLVVIIFALSVIKSFIKWLLTMLVIGGLLFFLLNNTDELQQFASVNSTEVLQDKQEEIVSELVNHGTELTFNKTEDGVYELSNEIVTLSGKPTDKTALLEVNGFTIEIAMTDEIKNLLNSQMKK